MIEVSVFMHIIGKIIEESHKSIIMNQYLVRLGSPMISLLSMKMDAQIN